MLCKASRAQFLDRESEMWDLKSLLECGTNAQQSNTEPKLGIKEKPWWPFIPLENYVSPLLHCEIGIGNLLFKLLRDIINKHIEKYAPGEQTI